MRFETRTPILLASALAVLLTPLALAQTETPAETTEPATDEVVEQGPPRADLREVNELVLEGSYPEAETMLAGMQEEFPEDPAVFLLRGEVLLAMRRADEAKTALERSLELDDAQPRAHFQLATALNVLGQRADALARFGTAAAADDSQIKLMSHLNRSTLFAQERKWEDAAQELEAVLELQPENVQVYGDLASMYLRAGKTDETSAALERGKQAGFVSAQHYYSLGARHYRDKNHAEAVVALKAALEVDPKMAKAERSLAASLEKIGKEAEALEHFRRYLVLAPDAADAEQIAAKIKRSEAN